MSLITPQSSISNWHSLPVDDGQSYNDPTQTIETDYEIITRAFIEEISGPEGLAELDRITALYKGEPETTWYATLSIYTLSLISWSSQAAEAAQKTEAINTKILEKLGAGIEDSITNNPEVLHLIETYAQKRNLDIDRIKKYTLIGENIAKLLFSPGYKADNGLKLELDGEEHAVPCDIETTRALSWYVMASAASQDVLRKHRNGGSESDLLDSGSIIMKDPDSRIFNFLTSNKETYKRISSHFHERTGHNESFFGSPLQRGIDDHSYYLPCDGGTLLFDVLKSDSKNTPELFMKFEKHGFPLPTSYQAFITWVGHASEYLKTRSAGGYKDGDNLRQEHTYKGFLKAVHEQIKELIGLAGKENIIAPAEAGKFLASIKKIGIIHIRQFIEDNLRGEASDAFKTSAEKVVKAIDDNLNALGFASDQHGIERRGAEVHISLNPAVVYRNANIIEDPVNLSSSQHWVSENVEEEVKTDGIEAGFSNSSHDLEQQPQVAERQATPVAAHIEADDGVPSGNDASEPENIMLNENVANPLIAEREESDDEEQASSNSSHDLEQQPQIAERQATPVATHAPISAMAQNVSSSDSAINPVSSEESRAELNAQEPASSDNVEQSHAESAENIENAEAPAAEKSPASPPPAGFFSRLFSFPKNLFLGFYDLLLNIGNRIWRFFKG